jgi:fumarylacetoacetate (FAA) hydrolase
MRLVTFEPPGPAGPPRLGLQVGETVVDLARAQLAAAGNGRGRRPDSPATMQAFLDGGPEIWAAARLVAQGLTEEQALQLRDERGAAAAWPRQAVRLWAPLPRPPSLRDFYAFEQHVRAAHEVRGRPMPDEWYEMPAFYFANAASIVGPGATVAAPADSRALDYELEVAAVIGRGGRDLTPDEAEAHIFGYTLMNDWSARDVQLKEMRVGLGPAKGKDFATSLGPCLVTADELASRHAGRVGVYDLAMRARVNGVERSKGNWRDVHFSFGEMIARASAEADLHPGDVIGSGTVGSGCLLELTRGQGPWLQPGDVVELEIDGIGKLANPVGKPRSGQPSPTGTPRLSQERPDA